MTDGISFGNVSTSGGNFRLTGTNSEIDTEAIVQAAYDARRFPAVRLEQKIEANNTREAAFNDLSSILNDVKTSVNALRNPPGFLGNADNVFESKQAFLTGSTAGDPNSVIGISLQNSAQAGSYALEVTQLATAQKLSSATTTAADQTLADALNGGAAFSGTLDISTGTGTPVAVDIDGTMTLADLRSAINATSDITGVSANVLQVSDNDFRLVLNASDTNQPINITDNSGIAGGFQTSEIQAAQPAIFSVDGITLTRDSNEVSDVINGVSLSLFQADPGNSIEVSIEPSLGGAKETIVQFVEAYNSFRDFVDQHSSVSAEGEVSQDSILFGNSVLRSITQEMSSLVGLSVDGLTDGSPSTLRDIGITIGTDNKLSIDDQTLDDALLTRSDDVRSIFEFKATTVSPNLVVSSHTGEFSGGNLEVAIIDADNDGVPESATFNGVAAEVDGNTIKGAEGSEFEGLSFFFAGNGSETVDVALSQGIADRFYNAVDTILDPYNGTIANEVQDLTDTNDRYTSQISQIDDRAERTRDILIEQFAAMEAALNISQSMLQQVQAQASAWSGG